MSPEELAEMARQRLFQTSQSTTFAPSKRSNKNGVSQKLQNTFTQILRGVPGAGRKGWLQIVAMVDAEGTGCRVATDQEERNLVRSAQNAYTTRGNYIV
jgi:hypothetical protein